MSALLSVRLMGADDKIIESLLPQKGHAYMYMYVGRSRKFDVWGNQKQ